MKKYQPRPELLVVQKAGCCDSKHDLVQWYVNVCLRLSELDRYSCFGGGADLERHLREHKIDEVVITGINTDPSGKVFFAICRLLRDMPCCPLSTCGGQDYCVLATAAWQAHGSIVQCSTAVGIREWLKASKST